MEHNLLLKKVAQNEEHIVLVAKEIQFVAGTVTDKTCKPKSHAY